MQTKADCDDSVHRLTGGLAIWRGDEYILPALAGFAIHLQFQPTNKADQ